MTEMNGKQMRTHHHERGVPANEPEDVKIFNLMFQCGMSPWRVQGVHTMFWKVLLLVFVVAIYMMIPYRAS